ncbi:SOS response-associated peptidase [Halomonas qinghailakensis]|uniref:Abasic site processing protein n=2 Tax=Halomonas TaxID=2745 RepID=A0AA46TSS1_9GAMM|nr:MULTISPECIES: SOS response-associated peptidase [Halomonas]UYO75641.1 SOS response-associated peptidase [Halomonas sp. ZZQ-149]UYV19488.1 SOS response-associated peptidase [Halomonas qaidamensis]
MTGRLHVQRLALSRLVPSLTNAEPLIESPNLAPRQPVSAIRLEQGRHQLQPLFWGLTPPWLKVLDHAPHCARAETLNQRAMFSEAFSARRCVIPVSGFYIWKIQAHSKQPYLVTHVNRGPLLLGALWCRYHTTLTAFTDSTALISVPANACLSSLTDRLPVVIPPDALTRWLDPTTPAESLNSLLMPAPLELLGAFPVSKHVNNPAYQSLSCAHPVGPMLRWAVS